MLPHRRILIMAFSTGIIAGLAASLNIEWMRYCVVVLIGVVGALFWQLNEIREEAERRVVRVVSHHLNNSLHIVMNRQLLDPNAREQIVDDQLHASKLDARFYGVRPAQRDPLIDQRLRDPDRDAAVAARY